MVDASFAQMTDEGAFKLSAFAGIFLLSLFASTLPTVSRRVSLLRIPQLAFFILKHFGTGVILSTAFVHLLQDAFDTLLTLPNNSALRHWVGLLVLVSLLVIFMIEYVSVTYVERLEDVDDSHVHAHGCEEHVHHEPHPTHCPERLSGPQDALHVHIQKQNGHSTLPTVAEIEDDASLSEPVTERSRLLRTASTPAASSESELPGIADAQAAAAASYTIPAVQRSAPGAVVPVFFSGHHRFEQPGAHAHHSAPSARVIARRSTTLGGESRNGVSDYFSTLFRQPHGHAHHHHDPHLHHHAEDLYDSFGTESSVEDGLCHEHEADCGTERGGHHRAAVDVGKRRQIINTLILQIGIMVHSLVIGLTLSIKSGPEFTSLVLAILFHQLFEGLSLGVRIASLAASAATGYVYACALAALFAAAVPFGGLIGRLTLTHGKTSDALQLTQGLMSALSAGTLIYAATVELLAADFVADPQLKRGSVRRQLLALVSLLAGVAAMAALAQVPHTLLNAPG